MEGFFTVNHSHLATYLVYKTNIIPIFNERYGKLQWVFPYSAELKEYSKEYYEIFKNNKEYLVDLNGILGALKIVMDVKSKYFRERKAIREI